METLKCSSVSFTYNGAAAPVLKDVSFALAEGSFTLLGGASGSGKSTLLRLLKKELVPYGMMRGEILLQGRPLDSLEDRESVARIGYVGRDCPLSAEYVWSQLAFVLESLNMPRQHMDLRLAELCAEFSLDKLFRRRISELSAGERQRVALAAALAAEPQLLLLDEPAAALDPLTAEHFLRALRAYQQRCHMTVLAAEHNIAALLPYCDDMLLLEEGELRYAGDKHSVCRQVTEDGSALAGALPECVRLFHALGGRGDCPMNSAELRLFLREQLPPRIQPPRRESSAAGEPLLTAERLIFKYEREAQPVLNEVSFTLRAGSCTALLGANGSGKSTLLRLAAGILKPVGGRIGSKGSAYLLPQQAGDIFIYPTLREEFSQAAAEADWRPLAEDFGLLPLLDRHYLDLSTGEKQRAALLRLLLKRPAVLLLDEPTVGLDHLAERRLIALLRQAAARGTAVLFATHDMDFAAALADRCLLLFDGRAAADMPAGDFLLQAGYFTTQTALASRGLLPARNAEELLGALRV